MEENKILEFTDNLWQYDIEDLELLISRIKDIIEIKEEEREER